MIDALAFVSGCLVGLPLGLLLGGFFLRWRAARRHQAAEARRLILLSVRTQPVALPVTVFDACPCASCTLRRQGGLRA